jgi:hypothetical protein
MTPHADTETLSAYLDGEVPASERARLERHLASCAECSARTSALEGVIRSVRGLPPVTATEAEHVAMRAAVLEASPRRAPKPGPAWKLLAATVAVAAVLAGIVGIVVVRGAGPNATTKVAAPAPSASLPGPALANDAEVRSYVQSRPGVRTFLGQPQAAAGAAPGAPAPAPAQVPSAFGQLNTVTPTAPTTRSAPNAAEAPAPPSPPTLGSCARAAVPEGAALLDATAVTYQGTPAWVIASGAPSGSTGPLNRVVVDVRSQSTCAVLDQTTITP